MGRAYVASRRVMQALVVNISWCASIACHTDNHQSTAFRVAKLFCHVRSCWSSHCCILCMNIFLSWASKVLAVVPLDRRASRLFLLSDGSDWVQVEKMRPQVRVSVASADWSLWFYRSMVIAEVFEWLNSLTVLQTSHYPCAPQISRQAASCSFGLSATSQQ